MQLSRDVPHLALYVLAAAFVLAVLVAASTSTAAFGTYNPDWDGTAELREEADEQTELHVIRETESYAAVEPNGTVAFVFAPRTAYDSADGARISEFVEEGGTLVVADNFGSHGNDLLAGIGADARFQGAMLRDEEHYYRSPTMPVALDTADHQYTGAVDQVTLNHGTAVEPNGATSVVNTSSLAYLDRDRSGDLSEDEELESYPVVTIEEVGDGRVIAIGDPSVFINTMLDRPGNQAFLSTLLTDHDRTVLDLSKAGSQPPITSVLLSVRASSGLQVILGLVVIGISAVGVARRDAATRIYSRRFGGPDLQTSHSDPAALAAKVREEHPDWDDDRVRRVIAGILPHERQESDND